MWTIVTRTKRKRGRPRNTWRRDLEADVTETEYTWRQLERMAQDRSARRSHAIGDEDWLALCSDSPKKS